MASKLALDFDKYCIEEYSKDYEKNKDKKARETVIKMVAERLTKTFAKNDSDRFIHDLNAFTNKELLKKSYKRAFRTENGYKAKKTISKILYGDKYINSMIKYQNDLSDRAVYDMAIFMYDHDFIVPQERLTEELADRLQTAFETFGFCEEDEKIYEVSKDKNGQLIIDPDRVFINPAIEVSDKELKEQGLTDAQIKEANALASLAKIYKDEDLLNNLEEPEEEDEEEESEKDEKAAKNSKKNAAEVVETVEADTIKKGSKSKKTDLEEKGKLEKVVVDVDYKEVPNGKKNFGKKKIKLDEVIDDPLGEASGKEGL